MEKLIDFLKVFISNYIQVLLNWSWQGKNTRKEYLMFLGANSCVALYVMQLDVHSGLYSPYWGMGPFYGMYVALVFWPGWCLAARRLRDAGLPPMRLWFLALPIIGWVLVTYWILFKPSKTYHHPKNMFIAEQEQRLARQ